MFAFSPDNTELWLRRNSSKMGPNGKMETPSTRFQNLFLFIGTLPNFKIGDTSQRQANGWVLWHRTLHDSQSFLDVSTPSTLTKLFCLFNGKYVAEPVLGLLLLYRICNGENVSLTPDQAFHQSLPSFVTVTNDLFIFQRPTSSRCLRFSTIPCLSQH